MDWEIKAGQTETGKRYLSYTCSKCGYELKVPFCREGPKNEEMQRLKMRKIVEHERSH